MLIVGCQTCGEAKILAGTPDKDGVARMNWTCRRCGTGQVLQLEMAADARSGDLRKILGGLALSECHDAAEGGVPDEAAGLPLNGLGGRVLLR